MGAHKKVVRARTVRNRKPVVRSKEQVTADRNELGQFAEGNKAAEKWTLEEAMELGVGLLRWLRKKNNVFYADYLHIENDYAADILVDLAVKYEPFADLKRRADRIQESKLCKLGISNAAAMPIFILKNKHGYRDRHDFTSADKELKSNSVNIDFSKISTKDLKEMLKSS